MRALPTVDVILTAADYDRGGFDSATIDGEIILNGAIELFAQEKQRKAPIMVGTLAGDASVFTLGAPPQ